MHSRLGCFFFFLDLIAFFFFFSNCGTLSGIVSQLVCEASDVTRTGFKEETEADRFLRRGH